VKRPQGFDRRPPGDPPKSKAQKAPAVPATPPPAQTAPARPAAPSRVAAPTSPAPDVASKASKKAQRGTTASAVPPGAERELKKAARARRRYERGEVRRFTRRSRRRRVAWLSVAITAVVLVGLVTVAVYSPLLALRTVTVVGTTRVDAAAVRDAVGDQVGKPLALVDFARVKTELSRFPLIRSFVTETVPPDTLVIRVTERAPVGSVATASGYSVVDPAGVEIEKSADRPPSLPLIDVGATDATGPAFRAAVAVLLALPASVLGKVDSVTAQTNDDVTLTLTGAGQSVVWGSAENSQLKARVLVALMQTQSPSSAVKYDVSAPTNPVVGPA
jgi:cell division protein FtsQ